MNYIRLTCRTPHRHRMDASGLLLERLVRTSLAEIQRIRVPVDGDDVELGECFEVSLKEEEGRRDGVLHLIGDGRHIDHLGHQHRRGHIQVDGSIGDHAGSCMTGGTILIDGDAGDGLAAPIGSRGLGMNGGLLHVTGSVGDLAGHRMRRGEIRIDGNAGNALAAWQIAGTILVGGSVGRHVAYGMRRGTLILNSAAEFSSARFTDAIELRTPFAELISTHSCQSESGASRASCLDADQPWRVQRGDRSIGGIGEVWTRS